MLKGNLDGKKKKTLVACLMDWLPLAKIPGKSGPDMTFPEEQTYGMVGGRRDNSLRIQDSMHACM